MNNERLIVVRGTDVMGSSSSAEDIAGVIKGQLVSDTPGACDADYSYCLSGNANTVSSLAMCPAARVRSQVEGLGWGGLGSVSGKMNRATGVAVVHYVGKQAGVSAGSLPGLGFGF